MGSNTRLKQDFGAWEPDGIYKDVGCGLHHSCLSCPLPQCVDGSTLKYNRAAVFPHMRHDMSGEELAEAANISVRTARSHVCRYNQVGGDLAKFIGE